MNFLIKIEDAINNLIILIFKKLKILIPHFILDLLPQIKKIFKIIIQFFLLKLQNLKSLLISFLGILKLKLTSGLGHFTELAIFLKSDQFKNHKYDLIIQFAQDLKRRPFFYLSRLMITGFVSFISFYIFRTANTVYIATLKTRSPASALTAEYVNENQIELKNHKFEIAVKAAGGHGGGGAAHHEEEVIFDIKIEATSEKQKEILEQMEEKLDVELEAFEFNISAVPIGKEEITANEKELLLYLNKEFSHIAHGNIIKSLSLKQIFKGRPEYYDRIEKTYSMKDLSLQIFLEDSTHNRQISFDYSLIASNRNIVLYFKEHEDKIRDRLSTQIEPVVPQLPIEDEGRSIIKEKIRLELNSLLKEEKIEGSVLEVYLDYIIGS